MIRYVSVNFQYLNDLSKLVSSDYKENNLKNQLATPRSHINIFKSLIKLREKQVLQEGSFESLVDDNLLIYKREYQGKQLFVVLNLGQNDQEVNLSSKFPNIPETIRVSVSSLNSDLIEGWVKEFIILNLSTDSCSFFQVMWSARINQSKFLRIQL